MALEEELATYEAKLPELKDREGKFALVKGRDLVDTFDTYSDALKAGYAKFGIDEPFMVKQIRSIEQTQLITRFFDRSSSPA